MSVKYRIARKPDGDKKPRWSKPLGIGEAHDLAIQRLQRHRGGYRIREMDPGEEFGPVRTLPELKRPLRKRMSNGRVGDKWTVDANSDAYELLIRKVDVEPPLHIVDTGGNQRLDKLHALIMQEFKGKGLQNWGVCVRRYIAGTFQWSQHSPWPQDHCEANAIDYGAGTALLDQLYRFIQQLKNQGEPVGLVLWRVSGHWDHLHLEASPTRGGSHCGSCG
jgi:hypothetical protein